MLAFYQFSTQLALNTINPPKNEKKKKKKKKKKTLPSSTEFFTRHAAFVHMN
jgi:hypothetical protein